MFFDAPYVTHVRYSLGTLAGVIEAVEIGMEAGVPVHVSHLKSRTPEEGEDILRYIDSTAMHVVDFSFDVYPYGSSSTMLQYMLPHEVWRDGPLGAITRLSDRKVRDTFARSLKHQMLDKTYIGWVSSRQNQQYQGWTLANYVEHVGKQPADALADLLVEEGMNVLLVFRGWAPNVVEPFLKHRCFMMGSDGIFFEDGVVHPRQYASATRLLAHYTRERGLLTLPEAIHKMSEKPARRFGLFERGLIKKDYFADIVVFDLEKLDERSQFGDPHHYAKGVSEVFVNGSPIILSGKAVPATDAWPGRVLRFKQA
jgi:N-acyl-D-aspartate/D-glutamate deacylase